MKNLWVIFFLAVFFLTGCQKEKKIIPSGTEIKIGILAPVTGTDQRYAQQSLKGIEIIRKLKPYLHNGDKIVFVIADTHSTVKGMQEALNKLQAEKVKVILSFCGSDQMLHVKESFLKTDIPLITTLATNDEIIHLSPYTTQVCMNNKTQAIVASHFIKDEKLMDNVIVLYLGDNLYSNELAKEFITNFKQLDGNLEGVFDLSKSENMQKFEKFDKKNIDMIFCVTNIKQSFKVMQIIDKQHLKTQVVFSDGLISSILAKDASKIASFEGVYAIEHFTHNLKLSSDKKIFLKNLEEEHLQQSSYALLAYDGYVLLYDVLNECSDGYQKKCLQAYLANMPLVKGLVGNFSIVDSQAKREVYVNKIINSQLIQEIVTY